MILLFSGLYYSAHSQLSGSGNALAFDGIDDYVNIGSNFTYQQFTVEMWVKPGAAQVTRANIIDNYHYDSRSWNCQQDAANTNHYLFGCATSNGTLVSHFSLNANVWQHVTLVKSATALETYVNGILSESTPWSGTIYYQDQFLRLGKWGGGTENWNGRLDEVRIWSKALSQSEIRERMCRKINNADPLFYTLAACYNFDESSGVVAVDGTLNAANGILINGAARVMSGAAIGNASANNYVTTGLPAVGIRFNEQDSFSVVYTGGSYNGVAGTHVYVVDKKPNTENGFKPVGSNDRYFGVFSANLNLPLYEASYSYTGNPFVTATNESAIQLFKRADNAALNWSNANADLNVAANTLTATGENTEYILGLPCGDIAANISADGPVSFCEGGSVTLTVSNGAAYLWNTGAGTRSITVSNTGSFSVTVLNAEGCSAGAAIDVVVNPCASQQAPGSGNALSFDGTEDEVDLGTSFTYQDFTVDMWVKPAATQQGKASIIDNYLTDFNNWGCQYDAYNRYNFWCITLSEKKWSVFSLAADRWQHLTIVKSATALETYVNGILQESTPISGTINFENPHLRFGRWRDTRQYWNGSMDEVRIWNTALTQLQIRERMCRKITNADPLFNNMVAYYNFDEHTGDIVFDQTTNALHGNLVNSPDRIVSGAAIGNSSSYNYVSTGLPAASLGYNGQDNIGVAYTGGTYSGQAGTHVYVVNEKPNSENGFRPGNNDRYFGVFNVNLDTPVYTAIYNYTGNPFVTTINEPAISLFKRNDNSFAKWSIANATLNASGNTLTATGQNTEYIIGLPCGDIAAEITVSGGLLNFCSGASITLACSPAASYLWSNGANTQSITVTTTGSYFVTVTNTAGCTETSTVVNLKENPCNVQHAPGSGKAISFDGVEDEADAGASFTYQNFTVDMWVNPGATQVTYADIIDNNHNQGQNWFCQQVGENTNEYYFGCSFGEGQVFSHFSIKANVWQHVSLVKSAIALETYVNGILSESTPWSGAINFSNQFLRLGKWGGGGRNWKGSMDEVRIWNTALTQAQIRERMCHKITSSDTLFTNLVAYYNFDEGEGNIIYDGTANATNGILINSPARITSGAAIGNTSSNNYTTTGLPGTSLGFNGQDNFGVTYTAGTYTGEAGTHVYVVNGKPTAENGFKPVASNDRYFGVFNVNLEAPAYTAIYNYTGNPAVTPANELDVRLFKRNSNNIINWANANANLNVNANTLTATGEHTEYILGLPCGNIDTTISTSGPVTFCEGGSVTLTCGPAASWLWSNGATTQSITIAEAGSYFVQVTNAEGCTLTSAAVKVKINCSPGSGNAVSFDGVNDRVDLGSSFSYQNFTVDMWVKPGATQVRNADLIDNNQTGFYNWHCEQDGNLTNSYFFRCANTYAHVSLTADVWQQVTLVKSATALETYVNGILSQSNPWSGDINLSAQFLRLGNWGGGGRNWNGSMDEVRFWNTPLTQSQIRERMCRKITNSDPLFNNLVAYYNFDERTGDIVTDQTSNAFDGNLINGPARITSGAPIGNTSSYNYVTAGLPAVGLSVNGQDNFEVAYTGGTYRGQAGTHLYMVNEKPNTENGIPGAGSNDRYFGVFSVNLAAPVYNATYNFNGNPFVTAVNEPDISLFKRIDNSAANWTNANADLNASDHTLTATGQNTEYMLGVLHCGNFTPSITAGGPLAFCPGGSVTLTSSVAASYLWSNGATTQNIVVTDSGSYSVTATNTGGCTAATTAVNVKLNPCNPQHAPGSGNALSFDGADDHIDLGTFFAFQNFTVDMWVKPGASQVTYADIIDNNHNQGQNWFCQQYGDNTNEYYFGCSSGGGQVFSHFFIKPNVWQHISLVKSANALETYVNGILSESTPWVGTINISGQFLRLGKWGGGGRNWNGSMDEVRIWNTPLTQAQIRERMCRKIPGSDPLYNNLVAYYNFDENTGDDIFDGSINAYNLSLIDGPARITSGAAIGNNSSYSYVSTGLPAAVLGYNGQDTLGITYTGGTYNGLAGTHVYMVNEKPNSENGFKPVGSNDRYFGVFNVSVEAPHYTAVYNYTGNPYVTVADEPGVSLFKRTGNNALNWTNANATLNTNLNTLTVTGQNTEYILGLSCGSISADITASGPLNFCNGGNVTLTCTPAASYLWSNGATTQSITVATAGSYSVTASNTSGCIASSAVVNVVINDCNIYCSASGSSNSHGYINKVFTCYGVNNTSCWNNGYADFTNLAATPAAFGHGLGIEITPGFIPGCTNRGVILRVWIDWNRDGDFTDLGELVFCPYAKISIKTKAWIKVPLTAVAGKTIMRIAVRQDRQPLSCGNFSYGEVEDYTINVLARKPSGPQANPADWEQEEAAGDIFTIYPNPVTNTMIVERSGYNEAAVVYSKAELTISDANGSTVAKSLLASLVQAVDVARIPAGIYFVTIKTATSTTTQKVVISH